MTARAKENTGMASTNRRRTTLIAALGLATAALAACGDGSDGNPDVSTAPPAGAASPQAGASLPGPNGAPPPSPTETRP